MLFELRKNFTAITYLWLLHLIGVLALTDTMFFFAKRFIISKDMLQIRYNVFITIQVLNFKEGKFNSTHRKIQ